MKHLFIFLVFLSCNVLYEQAHTSDWSVNISLDKKEYLVYEKIWLDVELKNISDKSLETQGIPTPNHLGFVVKVTDSSGNSLPYTGILVLYVGESVKSVKPDDFEYLPINLLSSFRLAEYKRDLFAPYGFFSYIPPGAYSVQVELEGEISNILNFEIKEPKGQELEALILLDKASKIAPVPENYHLLIPIYKELLDKYPTSVYAETSHESYISETHYQERVEGTFNYDSLTILMLKTYPNSGNCVGRLRSLKRNSKNINFTDFMSTYSQEYPNSRAAKYGQFLLRNDKLNTK